MKVTVINRHTALLHLPPARGHRRDFPGVTLNPGANEVDGEYLEALEDHPVVEEWIKLKLIGGPMLDAEHTEPEAREPVAASPRPAEPPAKPAEPNAPPPAPGDVKAP